MSFLRASVYPASSGLVGVAVALGIKSLKGSMSMSTGHTFATAVGIAGVPQLLTLNVLSEAPALFALLVLIWNVAPMLVSVVIFLAGARNVAWGWLIAVGMWGLWSALSTVIFHSSTGALGFLWAPLWGLVLIGPMGAVIAVAHTRKHLRDKIGKT